MNLRHFKSTIFLKIEDFIFLTPPFLHFLANFSLLLCYRTYLWPLIDRLQIVSVAYPPRLLIYEVRALQRQDFPQNRRFCIFDNIFAQHKTLVYKNGDSEVVLRVQPVYQTFSGASMVVVNGNTNQNSPAHFWY